MELSGQFPVQLLCKRIDIPRSSFYHWEKSVQHLSQQKNGLCRALHCFRNTITVFPPTATAG